MGRAPQPRRTDRRSGELFATRQATAASPIRRTSRPRPSQHERPHLRPRRPLPLCRPHRPICLPTSKATTGTATPRATPQIHRPTGTTTWKDGLGTVFNFALAGASLAVCAGTVRAGCAVAFAIAAVAVNTTAAIASGDPWGQVLATSAVGFGAGLLFGQIGSGIGGAVAGAENPGLGAALGGFIGGGVAAGVMTPLTGGNLGENIFIGAMNGAMAAAFSAALAERAALSEAEADMEGGGGPNDPPHLRDKLWYRPGRQARLAKALAAPTPTTLGCNIVKCVDADLAPADVVARARGWVYLYGRAPLGRETGATDVIDVHGDTTVRMATAGPTPDTITFTSAPGDTVLQFNHSHLVQHSPAPSSFDANVILGHPGSAISTFRPASETLNIMWVGSSGTLQQTFVSPWWNPATVNALY